VTIMSDRTDVAQRLVADVRDERGERRVRLLARARNMLYALQAEPDLSEEEALILAELVLLLWKPPMPWRELVCCRRGGSLHKAQRIAKRNVKRDTGKARRREGVALMREQLRDER
jgi:hypothetical protein